MHYQIRNCPHFCYGHVIPLFLHKQKEVVTRDAFSRVCSLKSHPAALIHAASFTCKAENTHTELWYKDRNLKRRCQHNAAQRERRTDVSKNVLQQETERQAALVIFTTICCSRSQNSCSLLFAMLQPHPIVKLCLISLEMLQDKKQEFNRHTLQLISLITLFC